MKNIINIFITAFIVLSMFACIEDKEVCADMAENTLPDDKEQIEFRLIAPVGNYTNTRKVANGSAEENRVDNLFIDIMDGGSLIESRSTTDGTLTFSTTEVDSVYIASAIFDIGTLKSGYVVRVRANEDTPAIISGQPVSPFYMSGTGVIKEGISRNFKASAHLLRGVAKLRTTVRKTSSTVPRELIIGDVKVQVIHVADKIRKYAPFSSHANEAVIENLPVSSLNYLDFPEVSLTDIALQELGELDGEAATFYSHYIYENYLEQESDYDPATNVTSVKLTIPVTDGITSRVIERTIPVKTEKSFRIKRNHIYSIDVQVLSLDEVKIFTDMLDWEDVGVTGDIVGTDFDIDRKEITLIKDITDPVKLVKVDCHTPGRLQIRALKPNKTDLMPITDLQLYYNGITETDKLVDNSGIYDLTAAQVMNFYCTTGSVPANYEGGFIEVSSDNVHVEYIPISSLDTFTPLDTEGTANSYIADRGAGSYSFTATVMGNGVDGIIDEGKFEDAMGNILTKAAGADIHPLSAKLLWQDTDELVEQVALVNGRGQVKMGRSRGNAVIAVYDKADPNAEDAKVLWSWHLWCTPTPKVIDFNVSKQTGNKYKVMDRNLGAITSAPGLGTTQGVHYQWGRKDPFSTALTYGSNARRTVLYDIRSVTSKIKISREKLTMSQAINHPEIYNIADFTYWLKDGNNPYLWGNPEGTDYTFPTSTLKTVYDPCPVGYKVPLGDVFLALAKESKIDTYPEDDYWIKEGNEYGTTFYCDGAGKDNTKTIYLPNTRDVYSFIVWGKYWLSYITDNPSYPAEERYSAAFSFSKGYNYWFPFSLEPARTASVRCVKE